MQGSVINERVIGQMNSSRSWGGEEGGERMVSTLRGNKPGVFGELSRAVSFDSTMMMVEHFLIPFPVLPFDRRV